jgi:anti-sigma factor ChrR (cupin superfamily)
MNKKNQYAVDILLAANAGLIPELAPSKAARERILLAIQAGIKKPEMQVVRQSDGQWHSIFPGVSIKLLRQDDEQQSQTTLWRLQPGAKVPRHQHRQDEECLILEGSIFHAGTEYFAGDYLLSPIGMPHDEFHAPQGALFLIRGEHLHKEMML